MQTYKKNTLNKKNTFQTCKISQFICTLDPFGNKIVDIFKDPPISHRDEHLNKMHENWMKK